MNVQRRGSNPVHDLKHTWISKIDGRSWQKLRVERVELIWIRICPQRETGDTTDNLKRRLKSVDDIFSREPVGLPRDSWKSWIRLVCHLVEHFFHAWHCIPVRAGVTSSKLGVPCNGVGFRSTNGRH